MFFSFFHHFTLLFFLFLFFHFFFFSPFHHFFHFFIFFMFLLCSFFGWCCCLPFSVWCYLPSPPLGVAVLSPVFGLGGATWSPLICKEVLLGFLLPLEWCYCFSFSFWWCCSLISSLFVPPLGGAASSPSSVGRCCLVSSFLCVVFLSFYVVLLGFFPVWVVLRFSSPFAWCCLPFVLWVVLRFSSPFVWCCLPFVLWVMRRQCVIKFNIHCSVVRKLQYITRVRPDLMFATKCLSYKLASPTLADLTRAKKVLGYLKGTRELNLFLTIPALKPNDLNKTSRHITGHSDADWAGDPVTRKSTSCTLCYVDQFLLTSECRGQGTVALSSGESELYALGALSAELIFAHAILKEIGLSFLIHTRADSSTARAVATKQGASRKMKHIHTRLLIHSEIWYFGNFWIRCHQ